MFNLLAEFFGGEISLNHAEWGELSRYLSPAENKLKEILDSRSTEET